MNRWLLPLVCCALLAVLSCEREPATPDAVILLVVDTLRPDRLSCYGYDGHETPNIDRIAARGVRFVNAHSAASWTVPSMGSMMTSLYPTQLGLVEVEPEPGEMLEWRVPRNQKSYDIPARAKTLAEYMRDAGFATGAFVNQPALNVSNRFTRGFDAWFYPDSAGVTQHDPSEPIPIRHEWGPTTARAFPADSALVQSFTGWIESVASSSKAFAWVHLLTPHAPYVPPARYRDAMRTASDAYNGEVRAVDELVGGVLAAVEAAVGLERALLVFVSDHGEAFGEHGMNEHGHTLHQEVTRVPLILAGPGLEAGRVADAHVPGVDLMPTVLELAGVDVGTVGEGHSLAPYLRGESYSRLVYAEGMLYGNTERSLLVNDTKMLFNAMDDSYSVFDVRADRAELRNVSAQQAEVASKMRQALDAMHERLKREFDAEHDPNEAPGAEDEELMRALRALGYVK